MRATSENQGSFLNRISIRRNQVVSMDGGNHEQEVEDIEIFQKHVADRFSNLLEESSSSSDNSASDCGSILSVAFLRKLLDAFLCCEAEFKALLIIGREPAQLAKPPLDRLIPELLDRSVKALDLCNAVTHGVDAVRHCQKLAEIVAAALGAAPIGEGQVRRATKALTSLAAAMAAEDKDCSAAAAVAKSTERSRSLGRKGSTAGGGGKDRGSVQLRSIWLGMGKGWSASKQIQAMSANLVPPRGAAEYNGLAHPVYIMSSVTVFVMWALVAAIPCRDRTGLAAAAGHLAAPRQSSWATPMIALQERVTEEWKRKEKRGSSGLLDEMQRVERAAVGLSEFAEAFKFPAEEAAAAAAQAAEMAEACRRMEEGLGPLQEQIREVFHKVVKTRTEVLEVLDQGGKFSTPTM